MPASKEQFEYHLTPAGWVAGDRDLDSGSVSRPVPHDRVLTVVCTETISSPGQPIESYGEVTFRSDDKALVERLLEQFGERNC